MKRTALFILVCAAPAALYSQQAKLTEANIEGPGKAATDTVKEAERVTVIEPVRQPAGQPAAKRSAKAPAAAPAKPAASSGASRSRAAADYAAKYLHVSPGSPVVGGKEAASTRSEAAADYAAKYLHVKPGAQVVGASGPAAGSAAPRVTPAAAAAPGEGGFRVLKRHVIVPGDTLWDLAAKYYNNPFMWGRIYNANFSTVSNPDRIYPKNELIIPDISELLIPYRTP